MIGTLSNILMIKADQIMLRVGGGYATFEQYIHQVGPFECIKIYKLMKNEKISFKESVVFFLRKLKAMASVLSRYMETSEDDQADLFKSAIDYLKHK